MRRNTFRRFFSPDPVARKVCIVALQRLMTTGGQSVQKANHRMVHISDPAARLTINRTPVLSKTSLQYELTAPTKEFTQELLA